MSQPFIFGQRLSNHAMDLNGENMGLADKICRHVVH
jgi:hypothetical protein